jgi:hypothetical protein
MRIDIDEQHNLRLKEIYNGVIIETNSGEELFLCMRDSGFEISYGDKRYSLQKGDINEMTFEKSIDRSHI